MTPSPVPLPPSPPPGDVAAALLLPGVERAQVALDGVRLVVHRAGPVDPADAAPGSVPVLLLHGLPQTSLAFRHLIPDLARDRRVLAPDLPGLGDSEVREPYDVTTLAGELAALVLHEVDGPVDVVGHDYGGTLALALAAARPDLVRRVVVLDAPYRQLDLVRSAPVLLAAVPVLPRALLALTGRRGVRLLLRATWRAHTRPDPHALDAYAAAYTARARRGAWLAHARAVVRPQFRRTVGAALAKPKVEHPGLHQATGGAGSVSVQRVLVVWGAADPVLPVRVGEAVVRDLGPGVDMVTLPGVGHYPLEEAPEVAVPVVSRFLRQGDVEAPAAPPADEPADDSADEADDREAGAADEPAGGGVAAPA